MKVLVIPDIHLKPYLFKQAAEYIHQGLADQAVCLMDIADDWNKQYDLELYKETYDAAIEFAKKFPDTLWCYGNHDLSYIWELRESGYSFSAAYLVKQKLTELKEVADIRYVHKIDHVLFSHGGLSKQFVESYVPHSKYHDIDYVVDSINQLEQEEMWQDESPIWLRPQYSYSCLYKPRKLLQVVGHTPVKNIERKGNLISCDVFSTYFDGTPIGSEEFLLLDTLTWKFKRI